MPPLTRELETAAQAAGTDITLLSRRQPAALPGAGPLRLPERIQAALAAPGELPIAGGDSTAVLSIQT
jgi:hypothetical protein